MTLARCIVSEFSDHIADCAKQYSGGRLLVGEHDRGKLPADVRLYPTSRAADGQKGEYSDHRNPHKEIAFGDRLKSTFSLVMVTTAVMKAVSSNR